MFTRKTVAALALLAFARAHSGKVTVTDSLGATRTVDIQANGAYSVDVSGLTGPFLFRAVGTVAGRTVSLASAATSSACSQDVGTRTPFSRTIGVVMRASALGALERLFGAARANGAPPTNDCDRQPLEDGRRNGIVQAGASWWRRACFAVSPPIRRERPTCSSPEAG